MRWGERRRWQDPEIVPFHSFVPQPLIKPVKMIAVADIGRATNGQKGGRMAGNKHDRGRAGGQVGRVGSIWQRAARSYLRWRDGRKVNVRVTQVLERRVKTQEKGRAGSVNRLIDFCCFMSAPQCESVCVYEEIHLSRVYAEKKTSVHPYTHVHIRCVVFCDFNITCG